MDTRVLVAVSFATLATPLAFLALVIPAAVRRSRGAPVGPRLTAAVTFAGSLALGVLAVAATFSFVLLAPLVVVGAAIVVGLWGRGGRRAAGLALIGLGLPEVLAAAAGSPIMFGPLGGAAGLDGPGSGLDAQSVGATFAAVAAAATGLGVVLGLAGGSTSDGPVEAPPLAGDAPLPRPPGLVARAILEPASVGPFSLPVIASLVAVVVTWLVVPAIVGGVLGVRGSSIGPTATAVLVAAVVGTEAYLRAFPARSRRAFEAFAWYGGAQLEAVRPFVGRVPRTPTAAERWLASHPPREGDAAVRAEILVLAGRFDEARTVAAAMPDATPQGRWARAASLDFVEWSSGAEGDLPALRAAVDELPDGTDDRLRGEVSYAAAEVRRRAADTSAAAGDVLEPLLAARVLLGHRADGALTRALRTRVFLAYAIGGAVLAAVLDLAGGGAAVALR